MSPTDSGSEGETGEKPLREKLKHTTIAKKGTDVVDAEPTQPGTGVGEPHLTNDSLEDQEALNGNARGKPARKRSLEAVGGPDISNDAPETEPLTPSSGGPMRKKTRELQVGEGRNAEDTSIDTGSTSFDKRDIATGKEALKATSTDSTMTAARNNTPPAQTDNEVEIPTAGLLSPRKKRSREVLDQEDSVREQKIPTTEETRARRSTEEERPSIADLDDEQHKLNSDNEAPSRSEKVEPAPESSEPAPIAKTGFGNTSAVSPFSTLLQSNSTKSANADTPQTSASAFAASGFAAFSNSKSPLTTLGNTPTVIPKAPFVDSSSSSSSFKPSFGFNGSKPSAFGSGFGTSGSSAFGSTTISSGFGTSNNNTFGGGMGSGFAGGPKLSSFAAPVGDTSIGNKSVEKPFGATEDSNSGGSDSGNDSDAPAEDVTTKEDESTTKFKIQDFDTGEENEDTIFVNRGKLFQFHPEQGSWKERGLGPIKLNVQRQTEPESQGTEPAAKEEKPEKEDDGDNDDDQNLSSSRPQARFVMRNTATHKVILNAPIFKEMKIKDPNGKQLVFTVPMDGKLIPYTLKMSKEEDVKSLWQKVQELQGKM